MTRARGAQGGGGPGLGCGCRKLGRALGLRVGSGMRFGNCCDGGRTPTSFQRLAGDEFVAGLWDGVGAVLGGFGVGWLDADQKRGEQSQRRDAVCVDGLACQVADALRVRPIAVRNEREGLAVATRAVRDGTGKSGYREGARGCRRGTEMAGLRLREIEIDGETDRVSEIDADLAVSKIHQADIQHCAQPFRSITVPQCEHVRRSRFE